MDSSQLYESLMAQATQGGWIKGFELRPKDVDPWGLGIFDPNVGPLRTHISEPAELSVNRRSSSRW